MSKFSEKGYFVKENAPIYLTMDMDKTAKWFEEVLGWYSNIVERDDDGKGCYGVVFDMLPEVELVHLAPFTGMQMFCGIPEPRLISFMQVKGIEKMYEYNSLVAKNTAAFVMDESEMQDIDTPEDWKMAELKYKIIRG